jgi:uncharacterized membrane protein
LALAFRAVWRQGERVKWIELAPDGITVRREIHGHAQETGRFHPAWVRLVERARSRGSNAAGRFLRPHGKAVEIGAFMADQERNELAASMRRVLDELKAGPGTTGMG